MVVVGVSAALHAKNSFYRIRLEFLSASTMELLWAKSSWFNAAHSLMLFHVWHEIW